MSGKYRTAVDHDILAGDTTTATVGILTALDADTVITGIETGVDYQGVLAGLQVQGVTILGITGVTHQHLVDDDILTHQRMEVPGRRVLEDDTFQHHILTLYERYHDRTQETLDGIPLLFCLGVGHIHIGTLLTLGITCGGYPVTRFHLLTAGNGKQFLPMGFRHLPLLDRTPVLTIAVNHSFSRDSDIGSTLGIDG